jgi:WD40 repeat protein
VVSSVSFSPDGKQVVSGSWDNSVRIWETSTGTCVSTLSGHNDPVLSVCFSPCGTKIVSGGGERKDVGGNGDFSIRIWDAETIAQNGGHRYTLLPCFGTNNFRTGVIFSMDWGGVTLLVG